MLTVSNLGDLSFAAVGSLDPKTKKRSIDHTYIVNSDSYNEIKKFRDDLLNTKRESISPVNLTRIRRKGTNYHMKVITSLEL